MACPKGIDIYNSLPKVQDTGNIRREMFIFKKDRP